MNNGADHEREGCSRYCVETAEWNALICSIAFFLIFSAFGTVQNYATSSHGDDGAISLAILYIVLTFSNIIIGLIASYMSPRWAMFLGSATYALYVAANIYEINYILYITAGIMGFGAALLWVAQGSFITKCSHEYERKHQLPKNSQLGYFNSIFWSWFVANQFVGNSLAAILFYFDISTTIVYIIFTSINVVGTFIFLFIKPFDSQQQQQQQYQQERNESIQSSDHYNKMEGNLGVQSSMMDEHDLSANNGINPQQQQQQQQQQQESQRNKSRENTKTTLSEIETIPFIDSKNESDSEIPAAVNIFSMISLWTKKQQLLLIPLSLYSGISQSFEYGNFPAQINDNFHKFAALAVFGFVDAICSKLFGPISDKIGRLPILTIAFFAHGTVYIYFYLYSQLYENDKSPTDTHKIQHDWYDFCIIAAFLGVGDAGFNTQLYVLYGSLLGEKSQVFANLKFWQSIAMTWGFLSSGVHEQWENVLISCFALLIAAALPLYLSSEVRRKSRPHY